MSAGAVVAMCDGQRDLSHRLDVGHAAQLMTDVGGLALQICLGRHRCGWMDGWMYVCVRMYVYVCMCMYIAIRIT